jgi:hypothetical protein
MERIAEPLVERVAREDREWAEARLHNAQHGNWLSPDECATCLVENEPDEDDPPIDLNREGDPTLNGAW